MTSLKEELYRNLLIKKKERGLKDLYFFNKYILETDKIIKEIEKQDNFLW
jgi:hypothetical protein